MVLMSGPSLITLEVARVQEAHIGCPSGERYLNNVTSLPVAEVRVDEFGHVLNVFLCLESRGILARQSNVCTLWRDSSMAKAVDNVLSQPVANGCASNGVQRRRFGCSLPQG